MRSYLFLFVFGEIKMGQYFTNEKLPSCIKTTNCFVLGKKFTFLTDNGVFSKDGLDFGSRLLLESIPLDEVGAKVLDMGCGYGVLGIILNKVTGASIDMVDVNLRALHLTKRNIEGNKCKNISVFESNCYENVGSKYNTIITNPPIRAGKKIVYEIVMNAKNYLEPDGNLFLVIRKEQGAKSLISDLGKIYDVEILEKKKGFFVLKCIF
jgi:16S rRNA (guanine1207-N2)-methyltransferase